MEAPVLFTFLFIVGCGGGHGLVRGGDGSAGCVLRIEGGLVRGTLREADGGATYVSYRGLPYAAQPVGSLRFKRLQTARGWPGVLDARHEGPVCPQQDLFYGGLMRPRASSEACIHANVHVPLFTDTHKQLDEGCGAALRRQGVHGALGGHGGRRRGLPVFVFVHGGGFAFGSGDGDVYGPEYLVAKGVIVVTFNYRLGALGFLSLDNAEVPGNLGLHDQVYLLQWVQRNIGAFGGDPGAVTLAGQSAGAASAHLLSLSPLAQGLFHKLILMSGYGARSFFTTSPSHSKMAASLLAQQFNVPESSLYQTLMNATVEDIIAKSIILHQQLGLVAFSPVVERKHNNVEPVLSEDPFQIITSGRSSNIPTMIGFTDNECKSFENAFVAFNAVKKLKETGLLLVPYSIIYDNPSKVAEILPKITQKYFDGNLSRPDALEKFIEYYTDLTFKYPALKTANLMAEKNSEPVYLYEFAYRGKYDILQRVMHRKWNGAAHVEDLLYIMKANSFKDVQIENDPVDNWMKRWMLAIFTNFIISGEPTPADVDTPPLWAPVEPGCTHCLELNNTISVRDNPYPGLLQFFDGLYEPISTPSNLIPMSNK